MAKVNGTPVGDNPTVIGARYPVVTTVLTGIGATETSILLILTSVRVEDHTDEQTLGITDISTDGDVDCF